MPDQDIVKKAVILSAGYGTRLGDRTRDLPKVMVPIGGKPMLEHHINWLRRAGVEEFYLNLHYLPEVIRDYFGDGSSWGVRIGYSEESELQGTAGALRGFVEFLDDTFLVQYGDVFSRLNLDRLASFHRQKGGVASLVVHPSSHPHDSDIVEVGEDEGISVIHHKPGSDRFGVLGNAGAYLLQPQVLNFLAPAGEEEDFCRDLFPRLLESGERLFAFNTQDLLLDVGTPERLEWIERYLSADSSS